MTRVLIVDDHPLVRAGVAAVLSGDERLEVVGEVSRAADVVGAVLSTKANVIVLDARLPDGEGMDVCADLRSRGIAVRVVMLTQLMTERVISRAFEAGVSAFVVKESTGDTLRQAVHAVAAGQKFVDPRVTERVVKLATKGLRKKGPYGLTPAEMRVVTLVPEGLTNQQIADKLTLSYETVKTHMRHAMEKIGIHDRTQLAALVVREGIA